MTALYFNENDCLTDSIGGSDFPQTLFVGYAVPPSGVICRLQPTKNVVCAVENIINEWQPPDTRNLTPGTFFFPFPAVSQFVAGARRTHISTRFKADCEQKNIMKYCKRPAIAVLEYGKMLLELQHLMKQFPDSFLFLPPVCFFGNQQLLSFVNQPKGKNIDNFVARLKNDCDFFKHEFNSSTT